MSEEEEDSMREETERCQRREDSVREERCQRREEDS